MKKTLAEINATIRELAEYTAMLTELQSQMDALKDDIKTYMNDEELEELLGENGEHVVWKRVISNRLDTTALKKSAEWGEVYKMFTKPSETRPFKFFA